MVLNPIGVISLGPKSGLCSAKLQTTLGSCEPGCHNAKKPISACAMILSNWINYLIFFILRFLKPKEVAFTSMGLGIRTRAKRFSEQWRPHLECSRSFIKKYSRGDVAVLGAGRLFDVPVKDLAAAGKVFLVDNDPGAVSSWRGVCDGERVSGQQIDVTGLFENFVADLEEFFKINKKRDDSKLVSFIAELTARAAQVHGLSLEELPDTVVSVNLLSQIPVYFIDELCTATVKHWGFSPSAPPPEAIDGAYRAFGEMLQREHLKLLAKSAERRVIVITDLEYYYYLPKEPKWQVEDGLYLSASYLESLPMMTLVGTDTWWWHIVPAGGESAHGEIHKVLALVFERS